MQPISLQQTMHRIAERKEATIQRRKRLQGEEARYTLILHSARKALDITINEYCLADTVHKLSGNRSTVPGWCYTGQPMDRLLLPRSDSVGPQFVIPLRR